MRHAASLLILPLLLAGSRTEAPGPATDIEIREWPVPWEASRPRDPFMAADGRVWFVGQTGNYIAYFDPRDESFHRIEIPDGAHPHNVIVGEDGIVWYAGNRNATIGRIDPRSRELRSIAMPEGVRDPHTLVFDANGDIWFTAQGANRIGKLDVRTEQVRVIEPPVAASRPYGIVIAPDGTIWANLFNTNLLASIDPRTFELSTVAVPREGARTRRLETTPDGNVWYVDYAEGYLGRYSPATGAFREWRSPSGGSSRPYAMAVDDRGRVWFVETGVEPNLFVGFDPATEQFVSSTAVPSGGGAVRHMYFHAPSRAIWFGTDTNRIGRAAVP